MGGQQLLVHRGRGSQPRETRILRGLPGRGGSRRGVAITTGDPVGPRETLTATVPEFVDYCNGEGWTPCLYSATSAVKEATDALGWPSLRVAEETVLPLGSLVFSGRKFQDVRSSISRATKAGITAEWIVFPQAPLSIRDHIEAISEEWVSDKSLPEMGFTRLTLGGINELDDNHVRCLIAIDGDRTIHGVTSWMPSTATARWSAGH